MEAHAANKEPVIVDASPAESNKSFLYDRLGGEEAVSACVDIFYENLVADEQLKKFFEGVAVERLRLHQKKFLKIAFTEIPADLDIVEYIISKHARLFTDLDLSEKHFDLVAGHLVGALQQLMVPTDLIDEVVGVVAPLRAIFENEAKRILEERGENNM